MPFTFIPDKGYELTFEVYDNADSAVDLSGLTIILEAKNRNGDILTITGTSSEPTLGYAEFTVPASWFEDTADVYDAQIHITDGANYLQHTEIFPLEAKAIVGSS